MLPPSRSNRFLSRRRLRVALTILTCLCGSVGAAVGLRDLMAHRGLLWVWGTVEIWNVVLPALAGLGVGWVLAAFSFGPRITLQNLGPAVVANVVFLAGVGVFSWMQVSSEAGFTFENRSDAAVNTGTDQPDIYIFLLDAVRRDGLMDSQGNVLEPFSNIREFAAQSVTFASARSTAPWTVPGHASLFTGLGTTDHGASQDMPFLIDELSTIAEQLSAEGYRTVGFSTNPWLSTSRGFAQGFEVYEEIWPTRERMPLIVQWANQLGYWKPWSDHRRDKGTTAALWRFSEMLNEAPDDEPLFVFVNLISAHPVLGAPDPHDRVMMSEQTAARGSGIWSITQDWSTMLTAETEPSPEDMQVLSDLYRGEIHFLDSSLGRVFDQLKERGRYDDSAIVVTSDHGCGLGEERHFGAGWDLHDRMLQIPLLIKRPGNIDAGQIRFEPSQINDVCPTALTIAGIEAPDAPNDRFGQDLFAAGTRSSSAFSFSRPMVMLNTLWLEHPRFDRTPWERYLLGIERDGWKMVWSSLQGYRLISLEDDPLEMGNRMESNPDLAKELRVQLQEIFGGTPESRIPLFNRFGTGPGTVTLDAATRESLRSLGYISGGGQD